uniref:Putative methyltransferase n=1 Tax=viral metagenome TaxID=1070528 RepID=A0A6M3LIU1_9ZZZZ
MKLDLYYGDAISISQEIVAPGSVDLIFTDPPYPKEYHYCYEFLAIEAARVLKPNGFLIAYAGPYWKHKVMMTLGEHLDYYYDFILLHGGDTTILWPRRIISGYKSLLCYTLKGSKALPVTNVLGKYNGAGGDKRFHRWGQEANSARYYIDVFSREGDLVVDYFLGAGTFAEACKAINRNFIGFENNKETFNIARARVDGAMGSKEKGRQSEFELLGADR